MSKHHTTTKVSKSQALKLGLAIEQSHRVSDKADDIALMLAKLAGHMRIAPSKSLTYGKDTVSAEIEGWQNRVVKDFDALFNMLTELNTRIREIDL